MKTFMGIGIIFLPLLYAFGVGEPTFASIGAIVIGVALGLAILSSERI